MSNILHITLLMLCLTGVVIGKSASDESVLPAVGENKSMNYDRIPENTAKGENEAYPANCVLLDENWDVVSGTVMLGNISDDELPHILANYKAVGVKAIYIEEQHYLDLDFDPNEGNVTIRLTEDYRNWKLEYATYFGPPILLIVVECMSEVAHIVNLYVSLTSVSNMYAPIFENLNSAGYYAVTTTSPMPPETLTNIKIRDPDYQVYPSSTSTISVSLQGTYSWAFTTQLSCTRGSCQFEVMPRYPITLQEPAQLTIHATDNDYSPLPKSATASLWIINN